VVWRERDLNGNRGRDRLENEGIVKMRKVKGGKRFNEQNGKREEKRKERMRVGEVK